MVHNIETSKFFDQGRWEGHGEVALEPIWRSVTMARIKRVIRPRQHHTSQLASIMSSNFRYLESPVANSMLECLCTDVATCYTLP